jgi:hypothetical protein
MNEQKQAVTFRGILRSQMPSGRKRNAVESVVDGFFGGELDKTVDAKIVKGTRIVRLYIAGEVAAELECDEVERVELPAVGQPA